jgi:hypothetical protein
VIWRIGSSVLLLAVLVVVVVGAAGDPWVAESAEALNYRELGITHGAHIRPVYIPVLPDSLGPEDYGYGKEILNFNDLVGKDIGLVMYFADWWGSSSGAAFDTFLSILIDYEITDPSRRPVIMITWAPLNGRTLNGCSKNYGWNNVIPPADILNGDCDTYITNFANQINARPERYIIRFAHEMNIEDSKWWPRHFGPSEDASLYVDMYRYVHQKFVDAGVDNVEWMWSPNYASNPPDAWNAIPNYYPGDAYVDWIGLSGYNWYIDGAPDPWRTFDHLYDDVLDDLTCRYAKPQIIAEIGSIEGSGALTKAGWIADAYQNVRNYPFVRSVVWFNDYAVENPADADFRVTTGAEWLYPDNVNPLPASTSAWTNAYAAAIADPIFTTSFPSLTAATPPHPICSELFLPIISK